MDRETVRMILLVLGVMVIMGVYVWGRYKERLLDFFYRRGEFDELGYEAEGNPAELDQSFSPREPVFDTRNELDDEPAPLVIPEVNDEEDYSLGREAAQPHRSQPAMARAGESAKAAPLGAPFLIQLSVVTGDSAFFNGEDLRDALVELDLIYGDMGIYHRYDREYREPLFSVASLVEPGTFPIENMETFECPGVVLFFQPSQVADPLSVFDDLVATCHELAVKLDGVEWDERREILTEDKLALMRERLEDAY